MKRLLPIFSLLALSAGLAVAAPASAPALRPDVIYYQNNDAGKRSAEEVKQRFGGRQEVQLWDGPLPALSGFPQPVSTERPLYPAEMRARKLEGKVTVEFIVGENGKVLDAAVVDTSNAGFNDEAVAAVRKWRFKPATRNGAPVRALLRVPVMFSLKP